MSILKSPLKTIRDHCLECGGTYAEVERCPCEKNCCLWPYRFGHDPKRAPRNLSDAQRQIMRERLARKNSPVSTGLENRHGQIQEEGIR